VEVGLSSELPPENNLFNMEGNGKYLLKEYEEFNANMKPTNVKFGPFRYRDISIRDRRRLSLLRMKVEEYLDSLSNEQLAGLLLDIKDPGSAGLIRAIINERDSYKKLKQGWSYKLGLVPTFTEVALFLMGLTFLLLLFSNIVFLEEILNFLLDDFDPRTIVVIIFFIVGLVMSVYHAFSNKKVSRASKKFMLFFAVIINFLVGFFAGFYILRNTKGFLVILPIINIISAFLLISLMRLGKITTMSISDKQAKLRELVLGAIMVVIIFTISQYIFHNYWAITFSLCLVYATNINNFINKWIFS